MSEYDIVIGLEVHVQLATKSKMFCSCPTAFGQEPNRNTCPVCLGLPGSLPVLNEKSVEYAVLAALAMNCEVQRMSKFDRKNYFYPDLPKGYQISQYDQPLAREGYIDLEMGEEMHRIRINRIHMEEDAGKLIHEGDIARSTESLVDLNRSSVPLVEIVTEPDITSPEQARLFLEELRSILLYLGVSDCNMEEGSLRCDANISLKEKDTERMGVKTELKNMNSFKAVERGLEYEVGRQRGRLERGAEIVQETRHWDEEAGRTVSLRSKEEAHDYRYFPEPDLRPLRLEKEWIRELEDRLPELPQSRRRRFREEYGLPEYDARFLTQSRPLADFFESAAGRYQDPKEVSNWLMGDMMRLLNENGIGIDEAPVEPEALVELLELIRSGKISSKIAKDVFEKMFTDGRSAGEIVEEEGLIQISDEDELGEIVRDVIEENPGVVDDILGGKEKAVGFLVGQIMKKTRGKANPQLANQLIRQELEL